MWFEAGHCMCWVWRLLGWTVVQAKVLSLLQGLGLLGKSSKVICRWLPLMLGLEDLGRSYTSPKLPLLPGLSYLLKAMFHVKSGHHLCQVCGRLLEVEVKGDPSCCLCWE